MKPAGGPIQELPMVDGRVFRYREIHADRYIVKKGKMVAFVCAKHGKQSLDGAYVRNDNALGTSRLRCIECDNEARYEHKKLLPKKAPSKHGPQEYRRYEVDGILGKVCGICGVWKPLVDFHKESTRGGNPNYRCRGCRNERLRAYNYIRLIRARVSEHSEEYKLASYERGSDYLQAMCWVLGIFTDRKLSTEERKRFLSEVRGVRDKEGATFEEKVQILLPLLPQRPRRDNPMAVL